MNRSCDEHSGSNRQEPCRAKRSECRGSVLVELALVLPIFLIVSFGGLEIVRTTTARKTTMQLSREAANIAYRKCFNRNGDAVQMQNCLNLCETQIRTSARNTINGGIQIILSYYQTDSATPPNLSLLTSVGGSASFPSRFSTTNGSISAGIRGLPNETIFVGEVYMPYSSIVGNLGRIFRYNTSYVYDASVF